MITVFIILIVVLIVGFVLIQNYNKNKESSEEKHERKASKILDLRYSDTYYHKDVTPWLNEMISDGVDSGIKNYEVLNHHFKITFNNDVEMVLWNANKYYAWLSNGKISIPDDDGKINVVEYDKKRPSPFFMLKLKNAIENYLSKNTKINNIPSAVKLSVIEKDEKEKV